VKIKKVFGHTTSIGFRLRLINEENEK